MVVAGLLQDQFTRLQQIYPDATVATLPDGTTLVTVPGVALPPGWSQPATTVSFIVPMGYPMARPDCFWAESGLRLSAGGMPRNSGVNQVPGTVEPRLWFSWHATVWSAATDTLLTYVRVIQRRFAEPC